MTIQVLSKIQVLSFHCCHHNIILSKVSLKNSPSSLHKRNVWNCGKANVEGIQSSISGVDWNYLFEGTTVHKKVEILNENLKNIFRNFIPSRTILCDYRQPQWMTKLTKNKFLKKAIKIDQSLFSE